MAERSPIGPTSAVCLPSVRAWQLAISSRAIRPIIVLVSLVFAPVTPFQHRGERGMVPRPPLAVAGKRAPRKVDIFLGFPGPPPSSFFWASEPPGDRMQIAPRAVWGRRLPMVVRCKRMQVVSFWPGETLPGSGVLDPPAKPLVGQTSSGKRAAATKSGRGPLQKRPPVPGVKRVVPPGGRGAHNGP